MTREEKFVYVTGFLMCAAIFAFMLAVKLRMG